MPFLCCGYDFSSVTLSIVNTAPPIPKGLQFALLRAIPAMGSDAYGSALAAALSTKTRQPVDVATVYMALSRLDAKGLLNTRQENVNGRGRPRKVYSLTQDGKRALEAGLRFYGMSNQ